MKNVRCAIIIVAILTLSGCSTLETFFSIGGGSGADTPARQLARARDLIRDGQDDTAHDLLGKIITEKSIPGVTDEALFHLGLLTLKEETEASGYPRTRETVERLAKEYPGSVWAVQATPLVDILVGRWLSEVSLGKVRRQVKTLRDSNLSLTRENKELRLNIEKLKSLEMELEQKSRR